MSVSAHPTPQPGTEEYQPVFVGGTLEELNAILTRYPTKQAALLPALWLVQRARGWISDRNMAEVAEVLGLTPALGACGFATPVLVNDDFLESVTPDQVPEIVRKYK